MIPILERGLLVFESAFAVSPCGADIPALEEDATDGWRLGDFLGDGEGLRPPILPIRRGADGERNFGDLIT